MHLSDWVATLLLICLIWSILAWDPGPRPYRNPPDEDLK